MGNEDWTIKAPAKVDNYIDMYRYRVLGCFLVSMIIVTFAFMMACLYVCVCVCVYVCMCVCMYVCVYVCP